MSSQSIKPYAIILDEVHGVKFQWHLKVGKNVDKHLIAPWFYFFEIQMDPYFKVKFQYRLVGPNWIGLTTSLG